MRGGCPFCDYSGPSPILSRYGDVIVFEPTRPVVRGHVLVVPMKHVRDATESTRVTAEVMRIAAHYAREIGHCNIITSVGEAATQTILHLHVHVIPRRAGDGLRLPWSPT